LGFSDFFNSSVISGAQYFTCFFIALARPVQFISWTFGGFDGPVAIFYSPFRPETAGLFCARFFGPF
jgi:hypothetical protein